MTMPLKHAILRRRVLALAILAALAATAVNAQNASTDRLKLTRGKDTPVCQAYLQRLKQSHFEVSPYCGRPEDESVSGFQRLERHYLTEVEALPLVNSVLKFMTVGDQNQVQRTYYSNAEHPELSRWSDDIELPAAISKYGSRTIVWTYTTPLDIENNGSPQRILVWQGYPAATRVEGSAGKAFDLPCAETRAFVLSAEGNTLDEAKTRAVFTEPAYVSTLESRSSKAANEHRVIPIGDSLGILLYQGRYYIDTADRPESANAPIAYAVFLHENGKTKKICALR